MIHWVPLELLDKRYTKLTRNWISEEFKKQRVDFNIIEGEQLDNKINVGSFLDVYGTNYYKSTQVQKISKLFSEGKIKDGDTFFIDDIWMPGIAAIKYMANMSGIEVKICGMYHAGSHTPSDDVAVKIGRDNWVKKYEESILLMCDKVFVGSEFHKYEIEKYHNQYFHNIIVSGLPFNSKSITKDIRKYRWKDKSKNVLFPHRNHPEKQPELFDKIADKVNETRPDINFIKTMELNLSKKELYKLMSRSRLMFSAALQENFGYATLESASFGCDLLLPNRVVYSEFYTFDCLYNNDNIDVLADMIIRKIDAKQPKRQPILKLIDKSVKKIITEVKKC